MKIDKIQYYANPKKYNHMKTIIAELIFSFAK